MKPLKGHEQSNVEIENKVVASFTDNKLFNYQQETMPSAMKDFYWHTLNVVSRTF